MNAKELLHQDKSLLRPFDLEKAKSGDRVCTYATTTALRHVAGPDAGGRHVFEIVSNESPSKGFLTNPQEEPHLRMLPLAWVEGKPVYAGDTVWNTRGSKSGILVSHFDKGGYLAGTNPERGGTSMSRPDLLTWAKPKTTREGWVNVYSDPVRTDVHSAFVSHAFHTKELAEQHAGGFSDKKFLARIRVEWEE